MVQRVEFKGRSYDFPDNVSQEQILAFLQEKAPTSQEQNSHETSELVFDELKGDKEYVSALESSWSYHNEGKKYTGTVEDLIEEDFEQWNLLDANLVAGSLGTALLHFKDIPDEERANTLTRFDRYDRAKITGAGSRASVEQAKSVGAGILSDPFSYSLVGNLPKIAKVGAGRTVMRQALSVGMKPAAAGAAASTISDIERQSREIAIGARTEIDSKQVREAAALGGIVGQASKTVPDLVKGTYGALTSPLQKMADVTRTVLPKSIKEPAAVRGVVARAAEDIADVGADLTIGGQKMSSNLAQMFNKTDNFFEQEYAKINGVGTPERVVTGALEQWQNLGVKVPNAALKTVERMQEGRLSTEEALRALRRQMGQQAKSAFEGKGDLIPDDGQMINELRDGLTNALTRSVKRVGGDTGKLDKAYSKWKKLQDTPLGKSLNKASRDNIEAEKLTSKLITGDFALSELNAFTTQLRRIEEMSNSKGLTDSVLKNLREGAGELLLSKDGARLKTLLSSGRGFKTLKILYPDLTGTWDDLEKLAKVLDPHAANSSSVIANMSAARVGALVGEKVLGKTGGIGGALAGVSAINGLISSKFFRNAMANSYLRKEGRLSKGVKHWMKNSKGMSPEEIQDVQVAMFAMPMGYVAGETYQLNTEGAD